LGIARQLLLVSENQSDFFVWYQSIRTASRGLSQSTRVTTRRTDGITTPKTALAYLIFDIRALWRSVLSIAACGGKLETSVGWE